MASKTDVIRKLSIPIAREMDLELVDIQYQREGKKWVLRILIDKIGGVTLDDCQNFSRALEDELDAQAPIDRSYLLEVASPGLDRPLVKRSDYERFSGEEVKIKTYAPLDGRKTFTGILEGLEGDDIQLRVDDELVQIPLDKIAKANLVPDF